MKALAKAAPGPSLGAPLTLQPLLSTGTAGIEPALADDPAEPPTPFWLPSPPAPPRAELGPDAAPPLLGLP